MKLNLHGKLEMIGFLLPLLSIVSFQDSPSQSLKGGSTGNDEITATILHYCVFVGPLKVHEFLHVSVLRELIVEVLFPGLIHQLPSTCCLWHPITRRSSWLVASLRVMDGLKPLSRPKISSLPTHNPSSLCFLGANSLDTFFFNLHIL